MPFGMITSPGFWSASHGPSHLAFKVIDGPFFPGASLVTVIVYWLSRVPVMTRCEVMVLPATIHTELIVMVLPDFSTSCLEQSPARPRAACMA